MTKILIAEDEPDIRDLIAFTLRFAGFEVVTASNGKEAVELAPAEMPDLILMDVRMPIMTGYDACRHFKADPQLMHIPVVFLSAKGQESEIQAGLEVGAEEYLLKPFGPNELTDLVPEGELSKRRPTGKEREDTVHTRNHPDAGKGRTVCARSAIASRQSARAGADRPGHRCSGAGYSPFTARTADRAGGGRAQACVRGEAFHADQIKRPRSGTGSAGCWHRASARTQPTVFSSG